MQSLKIVVLLLCGWSLAACDDGVGEEAPNPFDPNRLDPGELIVELNGIEYAPAPDAIRLKYTEASKELEVFIQETEVLMTIGLSDSGSRRTHLIGPAEPNSVVYRIGLGTPTEYSSNNDGGGGSVLIADFTSGGVQGTFTGTLVNSDDPSDEIVMTNGRFNLRF